MLRNQKAEEQVYFIYIIFKANQCLLLGVAFMWLSDLASAVLHVYRHRSAPDCS